MISFGDGGGVFFTDRDWLIARMVAMVAISTPIAQWRAAGDEAVV